ncbi:MAG: uridine kinase [Melioribacteraceae bacterium]|nr:uridine kinase [Melioribacteraceae bacterium]
MIILISGLSGSGKTTVAKKLIELIGVGHVSYLHQDAYYKDQSHLSIEERDQLNFDHPDALELDLLSEHISLLSNGEIIKQPQYDFSTHTRKNEYKIVYPKEIIIVDGIHVLSYEKIRNLADIKVYVDVDSDICFIRRLQRDIKERSRTVDSVISQYLKTVKPMQELYITPSRKYADIIIKEGGFNKVAIDLLNEKILNQQKESGI